MAAFQIKPLRDVKFIFANAIVCFVPNVFGIFLLPDSVQWQGFALDMHRLLTLLSAGITLSYTPYYIYAYKNALQANLALFFITLITNIGLSLLTFALGYGLLWAKFA